MQHFHGTRTTAKLLHREHGGLVFYPKRLASCLLPLSLKSAIAGTESRNEYEERAQMFIVSEMQKEIYNYLL